MQIEAEKMASFIELSPSPVVEMDFSGKIIYANPKARYMLSKSSAFETHIMNNLENLITVFRSGENETLEHEAKIDDAWWYLVFFHVQGTNAIRIYGTDITERRSAENLVRYHSKLINNVSDAIFSTDNNFIIKSWNKAAEIIFGWTANETIGSSLCDIFKSIFSSPNDAPLKQQIEELTQKGFYKGEVQYQKKDGTPILTMSSANMLKDRDGDPTGIVFIVHDITRRKHFEKKLEESEKRMKRSEEIAHLGAWDLDLANNLLTWSDEMYRIFGLKPQEFRATYEAFLDSVHPDDRQAVDQAYSGSLANGKDTYEIEHRIVRKDTGEIRSVHEKCEHIRDESGKITRSVGMTHDITDQKKLERSKSEFISLAAHQLRTPITTISLTAEMLLKEIAGKLDSRGKKYLRNILEDVQRMTELIETLLNVSRIEVGTFEIMPKPADPLRVLNQTLKEVNSQIKLKKIKLTKKLVKNAPIINIDQRVLQIIFENILSNSIKYTPDSGRIEVMVYTKDRRLVYKFSDTGCGIPEKEHSQVFTKLFRASNVRNGKTDGIGLGLHLVKSLIEKSGGNVWFKSKKDCGTSFYISIPLTGMLERKIKVSDI